MWRDQDDVSITLSKSDMVYGEYNWRDWFQSTLPSKGGDSKRRSCRWPKGFNHAPLSKGGDRSESGSCDEISKFQSTLSKGERRRRQGIVGMMRMVSIHAPLRRRRLHRVVGGG